MKKKVLSYYLDLMKSAQDKQEWVKEARYGEIALKKLPTLSYTPLEKYHLYMNLALSYFWTTEHYRSLDVCYKANLIASKHHLASEYIAYTSYMICPSLFYIRNINRALYQYQKVEKYYKEYGDGSILMNKMRYFITLTGLGYCYLAKNNLEKVKEIIEKKLSPMSLSLKNEVAYGYYYHLKGEYLMLLKDYTKARDCFQEYVNISKRLSNSPDQVLEGEIHLTTIDLLEGRLKSAIQSLTSLFKEAYHLKINDIICQVGLLLSKCYSLNSMPDKSIAIEKSIKRFLNKLDIIWLYEQTRELERLYHQLQPIYQFDGNPVPVILERTIQHHYELAGYRHTIISQSAPMIEIYQLIEKIAPTDLPVLIQGETGTGKELIARAIHNNSLRKVKTWLTLNCGAVPETLLENELFGHNKGAFTDAKEDRKGYIERASEGTLFMDEIADMSSNMQQKLLRVLEEKLVWRVGSEKPVPVNTRFIFASNQNIEELVKTKRFREDLYYRINTIVITLPPLRDRKDDIPLLINHFLAKYSSHNRPSSFVSHFSSDTLDLLINYNWPGNVRELENEIKRICALYQDTKMITGEMISETIRNYTPKTSSIQCQTALTLKELKKLAERDIIIEAIRKCEGNITKASHELGCLQPHLARRIKQLKISSISYVTKR